MWTRRRTASGAPAPETMERVPSETVAVVACSPACAECFPYFTPDRAGSWLPPPRINVVACAGGSTVDFRDVQEEELPDEVQINVCTFAASTIVIFPRALHVQVKSRGVKCEIHCAAACSMPNRSLNITSPTPLRAQLVRPRSAEGRQRAGTQTGAGIRVVSLWQHLCAHAGFRRRGCLVDSLTTATI